MVVVEVVVGFVVVVSAIVDVVFDGGAIVVVVFGLQQHDGTSSVHSIEPSVSYFSRFCRHSRWLALQTPVSYSL